MNKFPENLKSLMKRGDFDQAKLAKLSGVPNALIGMYVRGEKEPTIEYLISLSLGLGCSIDEIVGIETITIHERRLLEAYRQLPDGERKRIVELILLSDSYFDDPKQATGKIAVPVTQSEPSLK